MTSNSQGQRIFRFLQPFKKKSGWGILTGIALVGLFLSASAQAAGPTFIVNNHSDPIADNTAGNTVCETALGNNICSLRRAIIAANHTPGGAQRSSCRLYRQVAFILWKSLHPAQMTRPQAI
jgi:hypothetical protein